jgi:hypothetical protein
VICVSIAASPFRRGLSLSVPRERRRCSDARHRNRVYLDTPRDAEILQTESA